MEATNMITVSAHGLQTSMLLIENFGRTCFAIRFQLVAC